MTIKQTSDTICDLLNQSSFKVEAQEISNLINDILTLPKGSDTRKLAINNLISRCHPRWLGDYYINDIDYKKWTNLISDFKNQLKKEL